MVDSEKTKRGDKIDYEQPDGTNLRWFENRFYLLLVIGAVLLFGMMISPFTGMVSPLFCPADTTLTSMTNRLPAPPRIFTMHCLDSSGVMVQDATSLVFNLLWLLIIGFVIGTITFKGLHFVNLLRTAIRLDKERRVMADSEGHQEG